MIVATPSSSSRLVVAKAVFLLLGLTGLFWCGLTVSTFWNDFPMQQFTARIVRGETFSLDVLRDRLRKFESGSQFTECRAVAAHDRTVVQLSILHQSFNSASTSIDSDLETTRRSILASLTCLPADAYLWFALFQVESLRSGLQPGYLRYLGMSYQVGANEAWIAISRNRAAFAVFPALLDELQSRVLDEFCLLLRTELYREAIGIYLGPAQPYRDALNKRLETVPLRNRQMFASWLARLGVDAKIPGTTVIMRAGPKERNLIP